MRNFKKICFDKKEHGEQIKENRELLEKCYDIPMGAKIIDEFSRPENVCYCITFEHSSFEESPIGKNTPEQYYKGEFEGI